MDKPNYFSFSAGTYFLHGRHDKNKMKKQYLDTAYTM